MPADARREPPSHNAGHGEGRPPDGPPEEGSWAFARGLKSMFGWSPSQAAPALPPLTASGLRAQQESSQHDGGVHRPAASPSGQTTANVDIIVQFLLSITAVEITYWFEIAVTIELNATFSV